MSAIASQAVAVILKSAAYPRGGVPGRFRSRQHLCPFSFIPSSRLRFCAVSCLVQALAGLATFHVMLSSSSVVRGVSYSVAVHLKIESMDAALSESHQAARIRHDDLIQISSEIFYLPRPNAPGVQVAGLKNTIWIRSSAFSLPSCVGSLYSAFC
jgi:hypothetical protein